MEQARARRPRILILSAYYFPFQGGVETHARALAAYLKRQGFDVRVVTRHVDGASASEEIIDDVPVQRVWPRGARTGWRKWLMMPFAVGAILRRRREFDVLYCPGYQGIGLAAILCGRLLGRPVILRSGNLGVLAGDNWNAPLARWRIDPKGRVVNWLKRRVRRAYMTADAFACNCREIETEALACGVPRAKVHYLPNAVDVDEFRPPQAGEHERVRLSERWPSEGLVCLYVGRLSVEKGVLDLLEAWRALPPARATLVLIGPDMSENAMDAGPAAREFVAAHGLSKTVRFHGESRDAARLLRGADLYVQPSHYEAFSNALIEAMATGLPVVASRVGGMLDCIVDEENGLLCGPADPPDLARQIARLIADPDSRTRLGARARDTVVADFNKVTVFEKFAALFLAVDAEARRTGRA